MSKEERSTQPKQTSKVGHLHTVARQARRTEERLGKLARNSQRRWQHQEETLWTHHADQRKSNIPQNVFGDNNETIGTNKQDGTRHEASTKDRKTNLEKTKISETKACAREFDPASYVHGYDGAVHGQGSNRRSDGLLREPLQRREGEHGRGLSSSRLLAKLLDSQNRRERGMRDAHTSSTRNTKNTFEKENSEDGITAAILEALSEKKQTEALAENLSSMCCDLQFDEVSQQGQQFSSPRR